jgi:hypothetical protein
MSTATPEQVDLIAALNRLAMKLPQFLPKVITGDVEPQEWARLADIFADAELDMDTAITQASAVAELRAGRPSGEGQALRRTLL